MLQTEPLEERIYRANRSLSRFPKAGKTFAHTTTNFSSQTRLGWSELDGGGEEQRNNGFFLAEEEEN